MKVNIYFITLLKFLGTNSNEHISSGQLEIVGAMYNM